MPCPALSSAIHLPRPITDAGYQSEPPRATHAPRKIGCSGTICRPRTMHWPIQDNARHLRYTTGTMLHARNTPHFGVLYAYSMYIQTLPVKASCIITQLRWQTCVSFPLPLPPLCLSVFTIPASRVFLALQFVLGTLGVVYHFHICPDDATVFTSYSPLTRLVRSAFVR